MAPAVFYAAPALEVKYLAPVPLAYAAPVAAETVGFGSIRWQSAEMRSALDVLLWFLWSYTEEVLVGVSLRKFWRQGKRGFAAN